VLLFEDLHWADAGLLEFSEYLLDWSREFPLFVLTLSRPELGERQPTFGMRLRSATSLTLDPLRAAAMDELLDGLVPGLPEDVRTTIRERADGIPLYAVETVRMLLDRGVVTRDGERYRVSAPLEGLQVPETLHALIAARLDGLVPAERRTLQDAAVLGKTFTSAGLAAVSGTAVETLEPLLVALVRKELLAVQTDPRSPESGQFGFLQALVQRVAYETLARRDRKARHLAAAEYLGAQSGLDPDEIAEVIAAHYLDAHRAEPAADDSAAIKSEALGWLRRAGERAASLAATDDARRAFEEAAGLADEPVERARLLERAGDLARAGNKLDHAQAAPARGALPVRGCRRNPRRRARRGGTRHHAVAARAHRGGDRTDGDGACRARRRRAGRGRGDACRAARASPLGAAASREARSELGDRFEPGRSRLARGQAEPPRRPARGRCSVRWPVADAAHVRGRLAALPRARAPGCCGRRR
jgi:predicted ATPase